MARRSPPRKVTYFEPVPPRLARLDCGRLDSDAVIWPASGEWHPHMPERLDKEELADWRAGRDAVYQLAALRVGARLAVADG
ncbi:MAG: hypothetical protein WB611_31215 [Stellaceae bacterium]